jgi:hypothetical protein
MSHDKLEAMKEAHDALIAALDANDIAAIEAAVAAFGDSVRALREAAEPLGPDAAARAAELRRLSDQAQMRVNFLTDMVRRRIERLGAMGGRGQVALYAREGR